MKPQATLATLAALIGLAFSHAPVAAGDTIYSEQGKLIRAGEAVGTLGADLFGDKVNLYTGTVEFIQNDVSLPGNNALPVSVGRRLVTGGDSITNRGDRAFGDWELEIPHMHGVFALSGWQTSIGGNLRCTGFSAAPTANGTSGPSVWAGDEYWHGHFLYVPGAGSQEVLLRATNNTNFPNDGRAWPLATKNLWSIGCLNSMTLGVGEGFIAISPDGTQYQFDWMASRSYPAATKSDRSPVLSVAPGTGTTAMRSSGLPPSGSLLSQTVAGPRGGSELPNIVVGGLLKRVEVWIMPTLVTDRFGNTVRYTYNAAVPSQLQSIVASDGRSITFSYLAGTGRIASVSDGTRTWSYTYHSNAVGAMLDRVTLPDNTFWQFNADKLSAGTPIYLGDPGCDDEGGPEPTPATGSMTHPSGAQGSFTILSTTHSKSFVQRQCRVDSSGGEVSAFFPRYFVHKSLTNKTLSGPGLPSMAWNYAYSPAANTASWSTCTGTCPETKTVSVTDPRGYVTRYSFGNRHLVTEGQLQRVDSGWNGSTALRTTTTHYRDPAAGPYSANGGGFSPQRRGNGGLASRYTPEDQRVITQQGVSFIWNASGFDTKARPTVVARSSSLGSSRTETTAFYDHTSKWVLGQISTLTENSTGAQVVSNVYDASTASLTRSSKFGRLEQSFTYYPDGTLWTRKDGLNQTTTFANYWRGLARNATFADGTTESATIDNRGLITSVTDANNFTTSYQYDLIGRLNRIIRPTGDSVAWNDTTLIFEPVSADEYGLGVGHWRQTISTGNARTINYFDALWRPRLTRTFDAADTAGTSKTVLRNFDADNRKVFESYPARTIGSITATPVGTSTSFDGLGRPIYTFADSELGLLTTSVQYLGNFQKRVTNPRGYATTTGYQVFDEPSESAITTIAAPETLSVSIARDVFGKPSSITRSGTTGGSVSATRSYVYDGNQRLCKTIEPEIGATIQAYDAANNTAWRASGLALTSLACDPASVPAAKKVSYAYDSRNRLTSTSFGDASAGITRTYTADGLPRTVASDGTVWTYEYNRRRLLSKESLAQGGGIWPVTHTYSPNGHESQLTYPDNISVAYTPNALGEATTVGGHASGVSYHPNGAVAGYTLGNGIVHSLTQNTRGLPLQNRDGGVMQDLYGFDASGNVTAITDQQESVGSRSMGYDGLDRLRSAYSPNVWGSASYTYDALDNLRASTVGARVSTHNYNSTSNRLETVIANGAYTGYAYDTQGNITGRGTTGFYFDQANRMVWEGSTSWNIYDGLGRRVFTGTTDGRPMKNFMYSQAGQMLFGLSRQGMVNRFTRYVYLGGKLIAEVDSSTGVVEYVHTDALGSPVARTNTAAALLSRTRYEPYGNTAAGTVPNGIGFTGHVNDPDTGLVYMQQRYYDPVAGRFLSVDPVTTDANTGSAFNRFNYANNNPYRFTDPDGRDPDTPELPRSPIPPPADMKLLGQAMYKVLDTLSQPLQQGLNAIINAVSGGSEGSAPATPAAPAAGKGSGGDKDASTPTGQRGSPMDVPKGTNQPANIGGQEYGGHALDQMQGRGVTPTPVADTVQNGTQTPGNKPGRTVHTGQDGRLVVVTEGGKVVTVITK